MIVGSIDIGTNTILLLVAEISGSGNMRVLHDRQEIARLGRDVDANRLIRRDGMERAAGFLAEYKKTANSLGAEKIVAVGTSALRDAANSAEFCSFIADTVGIRIEILSGEDEARWTYRGGITEFTGAATNFSVLDIGGGSTEVVVGTRDAILSKRSYDIGCVRLTERFLRSSPPTETELTNARLYIEETFSTLSSFGISGTYPVAVAGTVTTMAAIHQRLPSYDPTKVTGYLLDRKIVAEIYGVLKTLTSDKIGALPQVSMGRADIILAGILIVEAFMKMAGIPALVVSDRGLRYGIVQREFEALGARGV